MQTLFNILSKKLCNSKKTFIIRKNLLSYDIQGSKHDIMPRKQITLYCENLVHSFGAHSFNRNKAGERQNELR